MRTIFWLAKHELRLAWRDWVGLLTAGKPKRTVWAMGGLATVVALMHLLAYAMLGSITAIDRADQGDLVVLGATALLSWCLMLSQALESVTRAFYARGDLELLLSSPTSPRLILTVRILAVAISISGMALLLTGPFINVLAVSEGLWWLSGYGIALGLGMVATAIAVIFTAILFRMVGAKRTRLVAQIVAAVIGAAFVIAVQVAAILSYGTLARTDLLQSEALISWALDPDNILWRSDRGAMGGEVLLLAAALMGGALSLCSTVALLGERFGRYALAATAADNASPKVRFGSRGFRGASARAALRRKEWVLLVRDPWLVSQTLMQLLYLIPPALLLWRNFGQGQTLLVLIPILVMAAGQLAGGLAWLAVSGEDAHDLIASAPIVPVHVLIAKVEAVLGAIVLVFAPFVGALALATPKQAGVAGMGILVSAFSATLIQLWYRAQAKRRRFRTRQTSSRLAMFAEAFSSIGWACTFAIIPLSPPVGFVCSIFPFLVLAIAWYTRPESR